MRARPSWMLPVLLAATSVGASMPAVAADGAGPLDAAVTISVDPPVVRLGPGERRLVYVRVDGIPEGGLAAFQLELRWDPRAIDVVDPNAGYGVDAFAPLGGSPLCAAIRRRTDCPDARWMLTTTGRQAYGATRADAEQGSLTVGYGTAGEALPPDGGGTLAVLELVGKIAGRAELRVADAILADAHDPPNRYRFDVRSDGPGPRPRRER